MRIEVFTEMINHRHHKDGSDDGDDEEGSGDHVFI